MFTVGDEMGRTQRGNISAYCWNLSPAQQDLLKFTRYLIRLWKEQPVLQRLKFFQGRSIRGAGVKDIVWYEPEGQEMTDEDWNVHFARCLGVLLNGEEMQEVDEEGNPLVGDTLLLMFNAHHGTIPFVLPNPSGTPQHWERLLDTAEPEWARRYVIHDHTYKLRGRSVAVFHLKRLPQRSVGEGA